MTGAEIYKNAFDQAADSRLLPLIAFGSYPMFSDGRKAPVLWKVLEEREGKSLLVSEISLDMLPYEEGDVSVSWEECSLRKYLNEVMPGKLFTEEEQKLIISVINENPDNELFRAKGGEPSAGGNPTEDRLFLLSGEEAEKYFSGERKGGARASDYACGRIGALPDGTNRSYWLRGPGMRRNLAVYVRSDGSVERTGYHVGCRDIAVRPAFWIDTDSPDFKRLTEIRYKEGVEAPKSTEKNTWDEPSRGRVKAGIIAGIIGIVFAVLTAALKLAAADIPLTVYLILAGCGLVLGIFGIASGIKSNRQTVLIIGITAAALALILAGIGYYMSMSHIWKIY